VRRPETVSHGSCLQYDLACHLVMSCTSLTDIPGNCEMLRGNSGEYPRPFPRLERARTVAPTSAMSSTGDLPEDTEKGKRQS
jgi:hypothetical protein